MAGNSPLRSLVEGLVFTGLLVLAGLAFGLLTVATAIPWIVFSLVLGVAAFGIRFASASRN